MLPLQFQMWVLPWSCHALQLQRTCCAGVRVLQTALKAKVARVRRTKGLLKTGVFATCVCKTLVLHTQVAKTGQKTKAELCLKE